MQHAGSELLQHLDHIRCRLIQRLNLEGVFRWLTGLGAAFLAVMGLFAVGLPGVGLRLLFWLPMLAWTAFLVFKYLVQPRRTYPDAAAAAAYLERVRPDLRDRLVSAAEFARDVGGRTAYSPVLAAATVTAVSADLKPIALPALLPPRHLKQQALYLIGIAAVLAIAIWSAPGPAAGTWWALWANHAGEAYHAGEVRFLAGDVSLSYTYPAYTGLPPVTVANSDGSIEAYPGSRVRISVRAAQAADEAELDLDEGADLALASLGDQRFGGELTVAVEDHYRFVFDGVRDGRERPIRVRPDRSPAVIVAFPGAELEVRESDSIELAYRLEDDFGLMRAELVVDYATGKGRVEKRLPLKQFDDIPRAYDGNFTWDLATFTFKAGDRVTYYVEAFDNDTVNGPKVGRSAVQILKVFSAAEHHQKLIAEQEKLWETMIEVLAKYLEQEVTLDTLPTSDAALKAMGDTAQELSQTIIEPLSHLNDQLEEDPLAADPVKQLMTNLLMEFSFNRDNYDEAYERHSRDGVTPSRRGWIVSDLARLREATVGRLEKGVMDLYELLKKQKYDALVAESQTLAELRDEIRKLLDEYRRTGDESLKERIGELLAELRERLNDMMTRMAQVVKEIPEDFINLDSLSSKEMDEGLDKLDEMLEDGNMDALMQQFEALSMDLNEMLDGLKKGSEDLGESLYAESMKKLLDFQKDLEQLIRAEQGLHEQTRAQSEDYQDALKKAMDPKKLKRAMAGLRKKAQRARQQIKDIGFHPDQGLRRQLEAGESELDNLDKLLATEDVGSALEQSRNAERRLSPLSEYLKQPYIRRYRSDQDAAADLKHAESATQLTKEVTQALEKLMPDPGKLMGEEARQQMESMARMQQKLQREGMSLDHQADKMSEEAPFMPSETGQWMQQAGEGMRKSQQSLSKMQPGQAEGHQQQAIHNLQQVRQGLQNAMQQMQQGMKFGGMKPGRHGNKPGGRHLKQEKVAIPQAEDYKTPKELREDILEAMKRKAPESYEPQNRQYYKELVR